MGVDLGGCQRGVPEDFLDRSQVGAAFEQMGGGGVPQPVRPEVGCSRYLGRSAHARACELRAGRSGRHAARRNSAAPLRPGTSELRTTAAAPASQRSFGRHPERDGALLASLAEDADNSALVHRCRRRRVRTAHRRGCRIAYSSSMMARSRRATGSSSPARAGITSSRSRICGWLSATGKVRWALGLASKAPESVGHPLGTECPGGEHPRGGRAPRQRGTRATARLLVGQPTA